MKSSETVLEFISQSQMLRLLMKQYHLKTIDFHSSSLSSFLIRSIPFTTYPGGIDCLKSFGINLWFRHRFRTFSSTPPSSNPIIKDTDQKRCFQTCSFPYNKI